MATAADANMPEAPENPLVSTARALFVGLAWGAVMLVVFGFWMRSKHDARAQIVTNTFLLAGVVTAGLAIWQMFTLWIKKDTPEAKAAALEQQRRIFSYAFLAGGLGLIVLAFVVGFVLGKRPSDNYVFIKDNFAETFGVLLFGIIALCSGYILQQPQGTNASPIQFLLGKVHTLKLSQIIIGLACLTGFVYLFWTHRQDFTAWFPELAALLCMSMLCLSCLLWLNTGQFDEFGIRLFVLVFGGSTGIVLFVMTMCRAYLWRQDILLGGTAAWQGENAWRFWLCAYLLFISLVLMFVSFGLARADIRTNVTLRRVMFGYDAIVQALLLLGVLTILNIVIYALVPFTFDWTKNRGAYALSDSSKNLISNLKTETNILVLLSQQSPVNKEVRTLLDNCQAIAPKDRLKVQYISPDLSQLEYASLVSKFPQIAPDPNVRGSGRGVLVVYGPVPDKEIPNPPPHAFVAEQKLFKFDQRPQKAGEKAKFTFQGEGEIIKELKFLVEGRKKRKVYILQGNDEPDIAGDDFAERQDFRRSFSTVGIAEFVARLNADNYDVAGLSFGLERPGEKTPPSLVFAKESGPDKKKNIPDDCHTLIVAGATKTLSSETLDAIERFMDHRNGRMLVYTDVVADDTWSKLQNSGIEAFLKRYGVEITNDFLLRLPDRQIQDPRTLVATASKKSENPLAKQFSDKGLIMRRSARVVKPAEVPGGRYKGETILQIEGPRDRFVFAEKDVKILNDLLPFLVERSKNRVQWSMGASNDPIPVAVAVSDNESKPRLVVFGDTEMITNLDLASSPTKATNYALAVSAMEWMAERESIGALPDVRTTFSLDPTVDYWRMILVPLWLMLLTLIGLGVGFWIVRRR